MRTLVHDIKYLNFYCTYVVLGTPPGICILLTSKIFYTEHSTDDLLRYRTVPVVRYVDLYGTVQFLGIRVQGATDTHGTVQ